MPKYFPAILKAKEDSTINPVENNNLNNIGFGAEFCGVTKTVITPNIPNSIDEYLKIFVAEIFIISLYQKLLKES